MGFDYDESGLPTTAAQSRVGGVLVDAGSWPLETVTQEQVIDDEIGDILVRVQRFATESSDEAEREARRVVEEAHFEAQRIVGAAHSQATYHAQAVSASAAADGQRILEEARAQTEHNARAVIDAARADAQRIVEEARRYAATLATSNAPTVSPDAVNNLTSSIVEFADTNRRLIEELVRLRDGLALPHTSQAAADQGTDQQLRADLLAHGTSRA